jgi:hypothetical protein
MYDQQMILLAAQLLQDRIIRFDYEVSLEPSVTPQFIALPRRVYFDFVHIDSYIEKKNCDVLSQIKKCR